MSPLTIIMGLPLVMAIILALVPRENRSIFRYGTLAATFGSLLIAIYVFGQFESQLEEAKGEVTYIEAAPLATQYGYTFTQRSDWIESLGISYHVGVDGIGVVMVLMAALVAFAAACCAREIQTRQKEFYILLLLMSGGILGAFMSLDLFLMYFLHELALVPTFIMIGVWGRGQNKEFAAYKITIYLSIGALLTLAGLILLYLHYKTFSLVEVLHAAGTGNTLANDSQSLVFALMMFGLGILVSLWPFHTWAPIGYAAAPTATAMMHAGVIKKFGLFMLIKVALPVLPAGAQVWLPVLALLCLGNILYCGLVAMRQKDLNLLIGNSSVAHMGFVFLGIASATLIGLTGAVMVMVAHGLLAGLAFGLSGYLHQQTRTLDMEKIQGLLAGMPFWGTLMIMALMAGCGLPGFANFAGELTVFFGAWETYPVITGIAVWSALVIGAVYMLRAIRKLLHGLKGAATPEIEDITSWQRLPYAILLAVLLLFGFYPRLITEKINQSEPTFSQATATQPKDTE